MLPDDQFDGGGTVEGIIKDMTVQPPTAVDSTSKGGQFFRGAAFTDRNSASSGSQVIDLIDSGTADRSIGWETAPPKGGGFACATFAYRRSYRCSQRSSFHSCQNEELAAQGLPARYIKVCLSRSHMSRCAIAQISQHRNRCKLKLPTTMHSPRCCALRSSVRTADKMVPHPLLAKTVEPITLQGDGGGAEAFRRFRPRACAFDEWPGENTMQM